MKKILILTAGFGEGHNTAAKNIKAGLDEVAQGQAESKVMDVFEIADPKKMAFCKKYYLQMIQNMPLAWRIIFEFTHRANWVQKHAGFFKRALQTLEEILQKEQPDVVCSTYPVYPNMFGRLHLEKFSKPFRKVTVVTDSITIHSSWFTAESDFFIVPNEDTKKIFLDAGLPAEKILPLGFPVQTLFADPQIAHSAPSPDGTPTILYMINGNKGYAEGILNDLLAHSTWKVTVLAGKDEKLKQRLQPIVEKSNGRAVLVGWCNDIPKMLMEHHVLICKAGGAIVQESIAARCPMIVNHIVPGQEMGNYVLLKNNNCCALANHPREIAPLIDQALSDGARQWKEWRANLEKFKTQDSSLKIADFLLKF